MRISDWSSDVCSSDLVRVRERKHHVTRRDLAHEVIERVASPIPVALGRPQIPARHLVAVRLVLVDPPVAHDHIMPGPPSHAQDSISAIPKNNSGAAAKGPTQGLWCSGRPALAGFYPEITDGCERVVGRAHVRNPVHTA